MKILIAVDEGPHTERMLAWMGRHREWFDAAHDYTVVHCVPAVPAGAAHMLSKDALRAYYEEEAEKAFGPVRRFFEAQGLKARFVHKVGQAGEQIAALATEGGFDVLAMGSHGHGALGKLIVGSVATKVMSLCSTSVLLLR